MRLSMLVLLSSTLFPCALRAQLCDGWVPIGDPAPRSGHAMAYDSARGAVVLFGGQYKAVPASQSFVRLCAEDTWEFDGRRWRFRSMAGPSGRSGHAMAYDSQRSVTVLFGGSQSYNFANLGDTWEWDGNTWTERPIPGPAPRERAAMAFHPGIQKVVLYGGRNPSGLLSDTWTYDGTAWAQLPIASSANGQQFHSMAFDPTRDRIVMQTGGGNFHEFDGASWAQVLSVYTNASLFITFDASRGRIVGLPRTANAVLHELTAAGWEPVAGAGTHSAADAVLMAHAASGTLVTLGQDTFQWGRAWGHTFRDGAWSVHSRPVPPGSFSTRFAYNPLSGTGLLHGGTNGPAGTWELRGESWIWRSPQSSSSLRFGLAFHPGSGAILEPRGNSTWRWDGGQWALHATGLSPGTGTIMCFHEGLQRLIGVQGSTVWDYDGANWSSGPAGANFANAAIAFDPQRNQVLVVGGSGARGTWAFDGAGFVQLLPEQTNHYGPMMAYDPSRQSLILFGGRSSTSTLPSLTYVLPSSAAAWGTLPVQGPLGRKLGSMIYDSAADRIVMYGGLAGELDTEMLETWKLARGETGVGRQPLATTAFEGQATELFLIAKGGGWLDYQWRKGGVPLEDGGRISGAYRDTLTIDAVQPGDAGSYDCVVTGPCGTVTSDAAILTVNCYANCDGSTSTPTLNVADFTCFLQQFASGNAYANCDASTQAPVLNVADFTCFLQSFAAGCP